MNHDVTYYRYKLKEWFPTWNSIDKMKPNQVIAIYLKERKKLVNKIIAMYDT